MQWIGALLAVRCFAWLDAFESIISLCMAKAKLVWKNLDDLPNLRRALIEVHVDVSTAGIPHHLGITLLPGRGIANPSSTMPRCSPLRVESQDGGAILVIGRGHLPSASEDVAVQGAVATLYTVDQCTECRECNQDRGDEQALLCARPGVCEREHLTRHKISDRWREGAWLQVKCGSHRKLGIRATSGSLHRLVRSLHQDRK